MFAEKNNRNIFENKKSKKVQQQFESLIICGATSKSDDLV
jgi:hypothetical protein